MAGTMPDQTLRSFIVRPAIPVLLFIELPIMTSIVLFEVTKFLKKGIEDDSSDVVLKFRIPERAS